MAPHAPRPFEFRLGRAGSGKTLSCLEDVAGHLALDPVGPPLLLLVPEQASAQMERRLVEMPGVGGYARARVVTFRWLRREAFEWGGGRPPELIDEIGRTLLLRRVLRRREKELRALGGAARLPGAAEALGATLEDLTRHGWSPDSLRARVAELLARDDGESRGSPAGRGRPSESVLADKLHDLALTWEDYRAALRDGMLADEADHCGLVADHLRRAPFLEGAMLWIDGFASFTHQERAILDALLDRVDTAVMTLCLDPAAVRPVGSAEDPLGRSPRGARLIGAERVFESLETAYRRLRERVERSGRRVEVVEFPTPGRGTRFDPSPSLERLESRALARLRPEPIDDAEWERERARFANDFGTRLRGGREDAAWPDGPVELLEAENRRCEVEAVARRIAALMTAAGPAPENFHPVHAVQDVDSVHDGPDGPDGPNGPDGLHGPDGPDEFGRPVELPRRPPLRPREMAVLVRDLEVYGPLAREIFPRFGIPFFLDERRRLATHPLPRFLLAALRLALDGRRTEWLLDYLGTGLAGAPESEVAGPDGPDVVARVVQVAREVRLLQPDWDEAVELARAAGVGRASCLSLPEGVTAAEEQLEWSSLDPDETSSFDSSLESSSAESSAGRDRQDARPTQPARPEITSPWARPERAALLPLIARALEPTDALGEDLRRPGADPARAVWRLMESCGVAARVEAWIERARSEGDEENAMLHEAAWRRSCELLDRLHAIGLASWAPPGPAPKGHGPSPPSSPSSPSRPSTRRKRADPSAPASASTASPATHVPHAPPDPREILETFEAGFATIQAGLVPPTLDQVLVGSIERSRTPPVKIAFVLGMNDGEFPRVHAEDPILGDLERELLAGGGREIGPDSHAKFATERFLAYIALTRASHALCVSRTVAGSRGEPTAPSSFFRAVREAFPRLRPKFVARDGVETEEGADARASGALARPMLPIEFAASAASAYHAARRGEGADCWLETLRGPHPLLAPDLARPGAESARRLVEVALASVEDPEPATLERATARDFWGGGASLAVTALESFGRCAYRFFGETMLRLERPIDPLPGPSELGTLRHHLLHRLYERLGGREAPLDWGAIDPDAAKRFLAEIAGRAFARDAPPRIAERFGRDTLSRAVARLAASEMHHYVDALHEMGRRCAYRQVAAEFRFGDRGATYAIRPEGPDDGFRFQLRGTVDRIDARSDGPSSGSADSDADESAGTRSDSRATPGREHLVLFDYKSTTRDPSGEAILEGLDLQLTAYALALREVWKAGAHPRPAIGGFFYWSLRVGHESAGGDPDEWAEPATREWFKKNGPRGFFDRDEADYLDRPPFPRAGGTGGGASGALARSRAKDSDDGGARAYAFPFSRLRKDGLDARGSWLPPGAMDALLDRVAERMAQRASAIRDGEIAASPVRTGRSVACDHCRMRPLCRRSEYGDEIERAIRKVPAKELRDRVC